MMTSISQKRAASLKDYGCYLALQEWSESVDPSLEVVKDVKKAISDGKDPKYLIPQFDLDVSEMGADFVDWSDIIDYIACGDYDIDAGLENS
jgi:hypothetical protein